MPKRNNANGGDATLFVRVPSKVKAEIEEKVKTAGKSQAFVVGRILEDFFSLPAADQDEILQKIGDRTTMGMISEMVMRLTWADHAFGVGRWTWACEEYAALAKLTSDNAPDTWALAQYKLGYCWNKIGRELLAGAIDFRHKKLLARSKLLGELRNERVHGQLYTSLSSVVIKLDGDELLRFVGLLDAADWSIRASIAFHERYYEKGHEREEPHCALIEYNNSCNWALRADLSMEKEMTKMTFAEIEMFEDKKNRAVSARHLRDVSSKREGNIGGRTWEFAQKALEGLESLRSMEKSHWVTPPVEDPTFLVTAARRDPDFDFLQRHPKFREAFYKYTGDDEDILNSYKEARKKCEREIEKHVDEIDRRKL